MTERDKNIIDLYLNHPELSNEDIAKKFGVSKATISRIARINNIPRRAGNSGIRLSLQQEQEIVQKYLNSISLLSLQKEYNISYDRIKALISKYTDINISAAKRLNPNLNEDYFESINTPIKAYWLGWIISDGSITNQPDKKKYALELTLKKSDIEILKTLEEDLGVQNKIYDSNTFYKRFSLGSKKIVKDLEKLGITQNKTFTVQIPEIPEEFTSDLIRGIFDGDGGITHYTRSTGQIVTELSFCGNELVINKIREILLKNIPNLTPNLVTKEANIKRIRWSKKSDLILLKQYLYQNCDDKHFLKRKFEILNANTEVTNQMAKG